MILDPHPDRYQNLILILGQKVKGEGHRVTKCNFPNLTHSASFCENRNHHIRLIVGVKRNHTRDNKTIKTKIVARVHNFSNNVVNRKTINQQKWKHYLLLRGETNRKHHIKNHIKLRWLTICILTPTASAAIRWTYSSVSGAKSKEQMLRETRSRRDCLRHRSRQRRRH